MRRLTLALQGLASLRESAAVSEVDLAAAATLAELAGVDVVRLAVGEDLKPIREEDIRDGILTLPAAIAIRDPEIRRLFCIDDDDEQRLMTLATACREQLDEAEAILDDIAATAKDEAMKFASDPIPLLALVDTVRPLSTR